MAKKLYHVIYEGKPLQLADRLAREPQDQADGTRTDHDTAKRLAVMLHGATVKEARR